MTRQDQINSMIEYATEGAPISERNLSSLRKQWATLSDAEIAEKYNAQQRRKARIEARAVR